MIRQLRRYVDHDTLTPLIRALILSRLDYCNSLFACSSQSTLRRLQRVQDAAAIDICVVFLPARVHQLSMSSRIQLKLLCTLMFLINHMALLHNTRQKSSGAVTTPGFRPMYVAIRRVTYSASCD